nr:type II toxin-antitoxin system HicB family antitoxin [uncultured Holophaga sp.]
MNIMTYKNFEGTVEVDMETYVCRGKILFIKDLVTYESDSIRGIESEFHAAVDDYIETCKELGRKPQKPLKGVFNVRVKPEIHKEATLRALKEGVKLNEIVCKSIDLYLHGSSSVTTNNYITLQEPRSQGLNSFTAGVKESNWSTGRSYGH